MISALDLPADLWARVGAFTLRRAAAGDLDDVIRLIADDAIGATRGDLARDTDRPRYAAALDEILSDSSNDLVVATLGGAVVGTFQLTRIPCLSRRGSTRLLIEAVRVRSDLRSAGIGGAMMRWVTERAATDAGAQLVQLTSDASRPDAHRFYERLGFVRSHAGFKRLVGG
ncbi:GNAT family N-acetyltransferase [Microbacterium sp. G2-8]|uniref:GNAT family N-acetyltransferase n=1 Tax=Microbacterium sp. G2-8 TaxID=2842454 RepID=UPI001C898D03|nr:GNAT family N-acetyltransferase [Microbacterium sp. G2-8]